MNLFEALQELDKIYLEEQRLVEAGTDYRGKAIKKIVDSGLFDEDTATKIIDALFREGIHAFVHSPAWLEKYLVGIANMLVKYCDGDKSKAKQFLIECPEVFEQYLTYVKTARVKLADKQRIELDNWFLNASYEDIVEWLDKYKKEQDKKSNAELSKMTFGEESSYELIPITSYKQMKEMFGGRWTGDGSSDSYAGAGGTAWCHTNSEDVYKDWTHKTRMFFVLANKNWKNIKFNPEANAISPKDAYGNSLIAILVNKVNGQLGKATLRCNHVGVNSNADNQYETYAELSKIAGFNVKDAVIKYLEENPVSVRKINWSMFNGSNLDELCDEAGVDREDITEAVIPNGVTSIDDHAFDGCSSLTDITIPDSVKTIGNDAFLGCENLKSITIGNSVTSIGDSAFLECSKLPSIIIPDGVTSIGKYAFDGCKNLKDITIPDSVTSIGWSAFSDCESLPRITIPNSVKTIGDWAFSGCSGLTSIEFDKPSSVTYICNHAFDGCSSLTSITIPNSVTSIGYKAFSGCKCHIIFECNKKVVTKDALKGFKGTYKFRL